MPRTPPHETHGRGYDIVYYTTTAARILLTISDDDANSPYLKGIAGISIMLLETVESVKSNKAQCLSMLVRIHGVLSAIINLCGNRKLLSPAILRHLSQFFDTLQKVHSYMRSQVDLGLFRRVLKHAETAALLQDCNAGLQDAIDALGIQTALETSEAIADLQDDAKIRHEELMELLQEVNSSKSTFTLHQSSSSSLYLMPSSPQIFYGRDREVEQLLKILLGPDPFRAAILGPGGIGKSSLALAVLHNENVVAKFGSHRYFISLESSTSAADMLNAIAAFFSIEPTAKLSRAIIRYLSDLSAPSVLVLDNLEDCWENGNSRGEVEDFLSLLSEITHIQLIVTMRGAERPGQVKWTRPFLVPLEPVDGDSARKIFLDIVDNIDADELTALLALTDNLPLAITLMANVASFEGGQSLLDRWASETTSLLSEGFNKAANLDKSILISLSSPRMLSNPHARDLLSLMSLIPDGITEEALAQMNLPFFGHIARSKSTLLRCSLIYTTADGRLRTLAPIREYVRENFPPAADSFNGLRSYYYEIASLFRNPTDLPNRELIQRLSAEFTNVRAVTSYALSRALYLEDTVRCTIDLLHFNASAKTAAFEFSDAVDRAVESLGDLVLKGDYLLAQARVLVGRPRCLELSSNALCCFEEKNDLLGQVRVLYTLASHLTLTGQFAQAKETAGRGARLAQQAGNLSLQALCMTASSKAYRSKGDLQTALLHGGEARHLAQASGNMTAEAWVTQQYASCCVMVGDYSRGADLCAEITSLLSALGLADLDVHAYKNVLNVSAEIFDRRTEYDAARALRMRIYRARRAFDGMAKAWDLLNVAQIDIELGDLASARANMDTAQSLVSPTVWKAAELDIHAEILEADLGFHNAEYEKAKQGLQRALTGSGWADLRIVAIEKLSNVALKMEDLGSALRYSVLLLAAARTSRDLAATHQAFRRLGDISLMNGDDSTAMNVFQLSLDGFRMMGIHRATGDCLLRMGDVLAGRGEKSKAREMWGEARLSFEKCSQKADVARCDGRLCDH
ncbi:hypothetical protein DFH07DRAFT_926556 [Mycena maculata]|uniref:Uncharacterized protein n=1 Tax=Mycena maculata TaxID=230809 RepID=A0AAD7ID69_9AGAR|nr:hypothetical protein DFH07DRAFT_926556 [Mycena maculata]